MAAPLSIVILARDEAGRIGGAVASAAFADEVLVADTGSLDGTVNEARRAGARVVELPWEGYVASRNRALGEARNDWVFFLDADERITPALRDELRAALEDAGGAVGFATPRLSSLLGTAIRHGTWYPDLKLRIARRSRGFRAVGGRVHETLVVDGPVRRLRGDVEHTPYRSVSDVIRKAVRYARLGADDRYEKGARAGAGALLVRPAFEMWRSYVWKAGFLDGRAGVRVAFLHGASYFLRAAFLLERARRDRGAGGGAREA